MHYIKWNEAQAEEMLMKHVHLSREKGAVAVMTAGVLYLFFLAPKIRAKNAE